MVYERVLCMGGPGTGKTQQIVNVCTWLAERKKEMWVLDLEDKIGAFLENQGGVPKNMHLKVALSWEEIREVVDEWKKEVKRDNWVAVDRVDLAWPMVQRWYTQQRFNEELADRLMKSSKSVTPNAMMIPRFTEGAWQVINANYDYFITNVLYLFRCSVLLTSGVKVSSEDSSPFEMFSDVGVMPRGQKELGHQPHTAFLLECKAERGRLGQVENRSWHITTAKDLPGRLYSSHDQLFDLSIQYLEKYST